MVRASIEELRQWGIVRWILVGLLIRLLLMPFFTHLDLLTDYWVAHLSAFEHRLPLDIRGGIYTFSWMHYLHSAFLWLSSFIDPGLRTCWPQQWGTFTEPGMTTLENWKQFASHAGVFQHLFLLKIPYLICDFLLLWVLLKLVSTPKQKRYVARFWLINPVVLAVTYVIGRYEIIPLLFIGLSLLYFQRKRLFFSGILLGCALVMKLYAMMFVPLFALACSRSWPARVKWAMVALAPGFIMIFIALLSGHALAFSGFATLPHNDYLTGLKLIIHPNDETNYIDALSLFILGYAFIFFALERCSPGFSLYWKSLFMALQLMYGLSFFHPQYFLWILPMWTLMAIHYRRTRPFFLLQVLLVIVYSFHWMRPMSTLLALPLAPHFFSTLPSPYEVINIAYPAIKLLTIARSVFTATAMWLIYLSMVSMKEEQP